MTLRLTIDAPRWRRHLDAVAAAVPGLVPVVKGDGYGIGAAVLAEQVRRMGFAAVAVGTTAEAAPLLRGTRADVVVLQPWTPSQGVADPRVVRTLARADAVRATAALLRAPRVVVELDSPVHRHGLTAAELRDVAPMLRALSVVGYSLHLPIGLAPARARRVVRDAVTALTVAGAPAADLWLSHVGDALAADLDADLPAWWGAGAAPRPTRDGGAPVQPRVRVRVGTRLWLGDREALRVTAEVIDVHPVRAGARVGYRQGRVRAGTIVVAGGGTAHGVGVRTDGAGRGWRRARQVAAAVLDAAGAVPSPFSWAGHRLRFADVPHMQVSMLVVPPGTAAPRVGQRLDVAVRLTTTRFDEVVLQESLGQVAA